MHMIYLRHLLTWVTDLDSQQGCEGPQGTEGESKAVCGLQLQRPRANREHHPAARRRLALSLPLHVTTPTSVPSAAGDRRE